MKLFFKKYGFNQILTIGIFFSRKTINVLQKHFTISEIWEGVYIFCHYSIMQYSSINNFLTNLKIISATTYLISIQILTIRAYIAHIFTKQSRSGVGEAGKPNKSLTAISMRLVIYFYLYKE